MWLILAFTSAIMLGFYDVAKKQALRHNAVPNILLLNTLLSSLIFLPVIISGEFSMGWFSNTIFDFGPATPRAHLLIFIKSIIVLSSWVFGYMGIKHLPITLVGPIKRNTPRNGTTWGYVALWGATQRPAMDRSRTCSCFTLSTESCRQTRRH